MVVRGRGFDDAIENAYTDARVDTSKPPLRECQDKFAQSLVAFRWNGTTSPSECDDGKDVTRVQLTIRVPVFKWGAAVPPCLG